MEHKLHKSINSTIKPFKPLLKFLYSCNLSIRVICVHVFVLYLFFFIMLLPSIVNGEKGKDVQVPVDMVFVKGGCYQMGDTFGDGESRERPVHKVGDDKPVHEVCVDDLYIGKHEVTVGEFREFVNATGYMTEDEIKDGCFVYIGREWKNDKSKNWRNLDFSQDDTHPVSCVSWNDAQEFIMWLNQKSPSNSLFSKGGFRLPTEAEWEYAARSGGKAEKWAGTNNESELSDYAWYDKNSERKTHPVGQKKPNGLGIYDMSGNVWEWVQDWYDEKYYSNSPKDNPKGADSGIYRVSRGGTWYNNKNRLRTSVRAQREPDKRADGTGFRLAAPVK